MRNIWPKIFLLSSVLAVLVSLLLVSWAVWLQGVSSSSANSYVSMKYLNQLGIVEKTLSPLLERPLEPGDQSELSAVRFNLLNLTVPAEAKEFHLALILKVQQLEEMLSSPALRDSSSVERLQAEIKNLFSRRW